ncbi:MAG: META domain-containing protein [Rhizobiaceae bacterium]|nr:META domain-containing protein [Rhizobiaceae bacterium]
MLEMRPGAEVVMVGKLLELMLFGLTPLLLGLIAVPVNLMAEERNLFGQVFYRERLLLPPKAKLTVQLADVSRADVAATVVGETTVAPVVQSPIPFKIRFDTRTIRPSASYALQARITVDDRLWFINPQLHAVAPLTAGPQSLMVQRVAGTSAVPADVLGDWLLESLAGAPPLKGTTVTLAFDADGRIAGKAGCNRYAASVVIDGHTIAISQAMATRMACPEPVMEQENRFLQDLAKAKAFEVDAGGLVLRDQAGAELMRLTRAA